MLPLRASARAASSAAAAARRGVHTIVFSRHGESEWNVSNRFTGWVDVHLTPKGVLEAKRGGAALKREGLVFDAAYTSVLSRAIKTCWTMLEELDQMHVPVANEWRLNERHYGALSGLNKAETTLKHGEEKVTLWRRSYDVPPPPYDAAHPHFVGRDRRYAKLAPADLPLAESTKSTGERVLPLWEKVLKPAVAGGQRLLVVAHGNSLRALVKHIDGISDDAIVKLNIPTGVPLLYQFDEKTFKPIPQKGCMDGLSGRYVGDLEAIKADIAKVAAQASAKKA